MTDTSMVDTEMEDQFARRKFSKPDWEEEFNRRFTLQHFSDEVREGGTDIQWELRAFIREVCEQAYDDGYAARDGMVEDDMGIAWQDGALEALEAVESIYWLSNGDGAFMDRADVAQAMMRMSKEFRHAHGLEEK